MWLGEPAGYSVTIWASSKKHLDWATLATSLHIDHAFIILPYLERIQPQIMELDYL